MRSLVGGCRRGWGRNEWGKGLELRECVGVVRECVVKYVVCLSRYPVESTAITLHSCRVCGISDWTVADLHRYGVVSHF